MELRYRDCGSDNTNKKMKNVRLEKEILGNEVNEGGGQVNM